MNMIRKARRLADQVGGGWLSAEAMQALTSSAKTSVEQVLLELIPLASEFARPALSGFHVGAVAQGVSGAVYFGGNVEFEGCGLNQTIHAEQAAVINAARHSETGLARLAVSAPPCGYCRQFLYELATADQLQILLADQPNTRLTDYLPGAFGPADLGVVGGLLSPTEHSLRWSTRSQADDRVQAVLESAQSSYAPYTQALGAVGLTLRNGENIVGPYLENVAFNPSVPPLQSALVGLALSGQRIEEVVEATVVQTKESRIDHASSTRNLLSHIGPHIRVRKRLVSLAPPTEENESMAKKSRVPPEALSFYFFDFDDNIMFLPTPILLRNKKTKRIKKVNTTQFASIRHLLGIPGQWEDFEYFDDTYSHFRDIPDDRRKANQQQYFVEDIEKAVASPQAKWQAPSWELFVYACRKQRPVSIVTARGHSRETLQAGIRVLVKNKLLPREPKYLSVYAVGNAEVQSELYESTSNEDERRELRKKGDHTSLYKRIAIRNSVEQALEQYGREPAHRFGMSDDDPHNVDLIIKAMCDCKKKHLDKRFFVINTHHGEWVKLEVFPVDFPVTGQAAKGETIG